jgi:MYXO-CTERM domain-containing protein
MKLNILRLLVLFMSASAGFAQITWQTWWRLGENDPGAGDGVVTNALAFNAIPTNDPNYHLNKEDGPDFYRADTPSASLLRFGPSTLSAEFNGTGTYGGYSIGIEGTTANMPSPAEYFGLEAWFKAANSTSGQRVILTVGDQDSGYAIMQNGSAIVVRFGSNTSQLDASLNAGVWTHVALVADDATATLYVNGTSVGSYATGTIGWEGSNYFGVGSQPRSPGGENFVGLIDEVRYFEYNSATGFNPGMLNYATAVPEPATYAGWAGLAVLGIAALRRRRQTKARA